MDITAVTEFQGVITAWYVTDGHVDKVEFLQELAWEHAMTAPIEKVEHVYRRFIPVRDEGGYWDLCSKGRGAKAFTEVESGWCRQLD